MPATRSSPARSRRGWIPAITAGWDGPDPDLRLGAACGSLILEGPGLYGVPFKVDAVRRMHGGDNPD